LSIADLGSPPFDVIRCNDPRLQVARPALVTFGSATVAQTAASADPATRQVLADAADWLRSWVRDSASALLDDLADELVHAWERLRPTVTFHADWPAPPRRPGLAPPLRPAVHEAVAPRLGLRGDPPPSLTACVSGTGVKIERLRQLTLQLRFVATEWVWAPRLDRALELGSESVDRSDYAAVLKAAGIARRPWYPEAVNALAELCGRDRRVAAYPDLDVARLAATAERVINRDHLGVVALRAIAADQQRPVSPEQVSAALSARGGGPATDGTWAWRTVAGRRTPALLRTAAGSMVSRRSKQSKPPCARKRRSSSKTDPATYQPWSAWPDRCAPSTSIAARSLRSSKRSAAHRDTCSPTANCDGSRLRLASALPAFPVTWPTMRSSSTTGRTRGPSWAITGSRDCDASRA
jgi:hypothetical protein